MQIEEIALADLKPYENNPRHNDDAVEYVAASIDEFGFKVPIVIDKNGVIAAGHTRYKAAKKLGLEKVPCIIADDLTPEQIKAFRLADNKVSELSTWDFEKLDAELLEIDMDLETFGFINATSINDDLLNDFFDDVEMDETNGTRKKLIKCPYCGKEFEK